MVVDWLVRIANEFQQHQQQHCRSR